jgi:hypothetical protein
MVTLASAACTASRPPPSPPAATAASPPPAGPATAAASAEDACTARPPEAPDLVEPPREQARASLALLIAPRVAAGHRAPGVAAGRRDPGREWSPTAMDLAFLRTPPAVVALPGGLQMRWNEHVSRQDALAAAHLARLWALRRGAPCLAAAQREEARFPALRELVSRSRAALRADLAPLAAGPDASPDVLLAAGMVEEEELNVALDRDPDLAGRERAVARGFYERAASGATDARRFWARYGQLRLAGTREAEQRAILSILAGTTPTSMMHLEARYRLAELLRPRCAEAAETYKLVIEEARQEPAPFARVLLLYGTLRLAEMHLCLEQPARAITTAAHLFDLTIEADIVRQASALVAFAMAQLERGEGAGLPAVPLLALGESARAVAAAATERGDPAAAAHALEAWRRADPGAISP